MFSILRVSLFLLGSAASTDALNPSSSWKQPGRNHRSSPDHNNHNHRRYRPRPAPVSSASASRLDEPATFDKQQQQQTTSTRNSHKVKGNIPSVDIASLSPAQVEREIVKLGRRGRIDQALQVYYSIDQPVIRQVNAIIDACSRCRPVRLDLAFEILDNSPVPPNVYTFGSLMSVCARAGSVHDAVQLLKSMEDDYGVSPNAVVYNTAVSACGRADPPRPAVALKLLKQARERNLRMSVVGYNAAISAAAHAGDWKGATDLLTQMEQSKADPDSMIPRPDSVSYGTVLSAFERGQEWSRLLEYAEHMQTEGHKLDGLAITSVLHACQSLGLSDEAIRYFNMMKDHDFVNEQRQTAGWKRAGGKAPLEGPDAVAYLLTVSACARGGAWLKGIELLKEYIQLTDIRNKEVDLSIFSAAIKGCEYAGKWEEAFLLLSSMRNQGIEPNEFALSGVIGACGTACAKEFEGDKDASSADVSPMKKAIRLLNVMRKDDKVLSPTTSVYNAAIRTCAEAHELEGALKLYSIMQADGVPVNAFTFGGLMTACERVESIDGLNKVFSLLKQQDGLKANNVIYGAAISCCRKAGEEERALLLLRKMIRDGLKPNVATFNTVLMAQAESRNSGNVARVYKFLTSVDDRPVEPNRQTYNIMIRAFADMKQPKEAESVLRNMRKAGLVPDVDLYTLVVSAYERTGQPLQALRLMESMNAEGYAFYEDKVLNAAFKRALKLTNMVGKTLSSDEKRPLSALDEDDNENFFK